MALPSFDELQKRLETSKSKASYDDRHACCWQGYLAALIEWGAITPDEHRRLTELVPTSEPNPVLEIFLD
jgi:hypothetical protein